MRQLAAICGLVGMVLAPWADASAARSDAGLQVALDKPVELDAADVPIAQVFQRLTGLTGVKFTIGPEVYACLPYGELTRMSVKVPKTTLREALSPMLAPLAMEWTIEGRAVRIVPSPALLRMTRRATREELIVLGKIHSVRMQPTDKAGPVIEQLRKATGDKDLNLLFHMPEVDGNALIERAERVLPAVAAAWLDMLCHGQGRTWYLWGDDIMIVEKKMQIGRQLRRQVSLRYENAELVTVLLDLARQARLKLSMEPGVMDYLPSETRENFNLVMAEATIGQALEVISGATGLVFLREDEGIKVQASERLKDQTPAGADARKPRLFYLKKSMPLPGGGTVDIIVPPEEVPEDIRKAILTERERLFKALRRTYGLTTQPAATQPAAP
jgi:hypothetical protein